MKISDILRIAAKNINGKWALFPALGAAIAMFCFCFVGGAAADVGAQKAQPYELNVSPGTEELTDSVILDISQNEDVKAVTPVILVPAQIDVGEYSAQLVLAGIDGAYLEGEFEEGGIFPDTSTMPYIVINEEAAVQFMDDGKAVDEEQGIDWLNESIKIQVGDGARHIVSKISGILKNEEENEQAAAYVSLSVSKQLLQQSGQYTGYSGALVRIVDMGSAESVSKQIFASGLIVANPNEELQTEWDALMKEANYLLAAGIFGLVGTVVLVAAWRKISLAEQEQAYAMLHWMGMKIKTLRRLVAVQCVMISLAGVALGLVVSVSLPAFLSQGVGESIFTMTIPLETAALSALICVVTCVLPMLKIKIPIKRMMII